MSIEDQVRVLLKSLIKKKGLNYTDLAHELNVSEVTVKRLFSTKRISLRDLDDVCEVLEVCPVEVLNLAKGDSSQLTELTNEQEEFLCNHPKHDYMFLRLIAGFQIEEIVRELALGVSETNKIVEDLNRLHLVKRTKSGKIIVREKGPFRWRKNGPFESRYKELFFNQVCSSLISLHQENDKSDTSFCSAFEMYLSRESFQSLSQDLQAVIGKHRKNSRIDHITHDAKDLLPISLLVGSFEGNTWKKILIDSPVLPQKQPTSGPGK